MRRFLAVALLLLALAPSCMGIFTPQWSYYYVSGLDSVYAADLDKNGLVEIYASSYEPRRPMLLVFNNNGGLSYDILVPRPGLIEYGSEDVTYMQPSDLNGDGMLDLLSGTEIIAGSINSHRLYRLERLYEGDLKRYRTTMSWMYTRHGLVTGIVLVPAKISNQSYDIYTSSLDLNVRQIDSNGNLLNNITLAGSVFDLQPFDSGNGTFGMVAASYKHLYLLGSDLKVVWDYPSEIRFTKVYASDVDNDSLTDVFAVSGDLLYRFNHRGVLIWNKRVGKVETNIHSADFDHDGVQDLFFGAGRSIVGLNPKGEKVWEVELNDTPRSVYASDLFNDGNFSLMVAYGKGLLVFGFNVFKNQTESLIYEARGMLVLANEYSNRGNYSMALNYTGRARDLFLEANDSASANECDLLLEKIGWAVSAEKFYNEALVELDSGLLQSAMNHTLLSLELYTKVGSADGVSKAGSLNETIFQSMYGKGNLSLADSLYSQAESYYVYGDFELAVESARNASVYYRIAGRSDGVAKCDSLINSALERIREKSTTTLPLVTTTTLPKAPGYEDYLLYGGVAVLLVILLLIVFTLRRR